MSLPVDPCGPAQDSDACFCGHNLAQHLFVLRHDKYGHPHATQKRYCGESGCGCVAPSSPREAINTVANVLTGLVEVLAKTAGVKT